MDAIIALVLVVLAVAIYQGKPIKVEIKHVYPEAQVLEEPEEIKQEQDLTGFAAALSEINDIMTGGGPYGR